MSLDSKAAIYQAIYGTIIADAGVKALIGDPARVYSVGGVPESLWPGSDNDFPSYVTVGRGEGDIGNIQTKIEDGMDGRVWVETWSAQHSALECAQIQEAVADAVTLSALSMPSGHTLILIYLEYSANFLDESWRSPLQHGIQRWRFMTERG